MDDQTRIMDEGTAIYPLDPALAVAAEPCPHCSEQIPVGDQFCPKCGYQRDTWAEGVTADAAPAADAEEAGNARFRLTLGDDRFMLPDGETVAGRSADADATIPDGYISRRHARFVVDGDTVKVIDLGSANGSFLGAEKLTPDEEYELAVGAVVKLGRSELTLEAVEQLEPAEEESPPEADETMVAAPEDTPAEDAPAEEAVSGELQQVGMLGDTALSPWVLKRDGEDEEFHLPCAGTVFGRKPDKCDAVILGDGYISGKHARVIAGLETLEVTDLGSTNGTYVNNERVAPDQVVALKAGDTLRIGQTDLAVVFTEEIAESADDA